MLDFDYGRGHQLLATVYDWERKDVVVHLYFSVELIVIYSNGSVAGFMLPSVGHPRPAAFLILILMSPSRAQLQRRVRSQSNQRASEAEHGTPRSLQGV